MNLQFAAGKTQTFINNILFPEFGEKERENKKNLSLLRMKNKNSEKIKLLLPVLREKNRYLAYEILSEKEISKADAENLVNSSLLRLLGELAIAKAGLMFIKFNKNKGVIKVNKKYINPLKAAIALIKEKDSIVRSLGTSGMVKNMKKYGV